MIAVTLALLVAIVSLLYAFLVWNYDYWSKQGVPGPKPKLFVGNYAGGISQKRHLVYDLDDIYREYKDKTDFVGIYNSRMPQLLPVNHNLVHRIFVNDFKHFHDNEFSAMVDDKSDYLFANNPFALTGEKWKDIRIEVTPGLAISRVKNSFPVTLKVCKNFIAYIRQQMRLKHKDGLDTKNACLRYTSEISSDVILGVQAKSFTDNPTPIFGMAKKLFDQSYVLLVYMVLTGLLPSIRRFYKVTIVPKSVEKFFVDLMTRAINLRKDNPMNRIDFMNYLLHLQQKRNLNVSELTAHTMFFFLDGFETTAAAITHCLLLLARSKQKQQILRDEIYEMLGKEGDIDFDKLTEMPYLDACLHESIRIFPQGFLLSKICTEPIEWVNKDGSVLKVRKGQIITLPVYSIMTDEDLYHEPQKFKPERFLPENGGVKKYRDMGAYYGFGEGPRVCLGMRFALAQMKAAIVEILRNFNVKVNPKTRSDNLFDRTHFMARLDGDVWLDFSELQ